MRQYVLNYCRRSGVHYAYIPDDFNWIVTRDSDCWQIGQTCIQKETAKLWQGRRSKLFHLKDLSHEILIMKVDIEWER
jgi:hypothetical protein